LDIERNSKTSELDAVHQRSVTELGNAQVDHHRGEMGEAYPTPACFVAPERDAAPVLHAGEQVLDIPYETPLIS